MARCNRVFASHSGRLFLVVLVIGGLLRPTRVWAQQPRNALGGEIGFFVPPHDVVTSNHSGQITLTEGPMWQALYERCLSGDTSVRFDVGWAKSHAGEERNTGIRDVWFSGDLLQHAGDSRVRPFVGAGLGIYVVRKQEFGVDLPQKKIGISVLGGVEYFTSRTLAIKAEARYHLVERLDDLTTADNASGLSFSIGITHHF